MESKETGGPGAALAKGLSQLAKRAVTRLADMRERQALRNDFARWDASGELQAALEAMGLASGQVPSFIEGYPESLRLLPAMAERVGIDLEQVANPVLRQDMKRVCALCGARARCRRWLQSGKRDGYREFCANAEMLEDLRAEVWLPRFGPGM